MKCIGKPFKGVVRIAFSIAHNNQAALPPHEFVDTQVLYVPTVGLLKFEDIEKPVAADDEVLVKVHAASVNPLDWHYMRGSPYIMRVMSGLSAPNDTSMGVDFAGTVEAVGANVKRFKPGDEVFGGTGGCLLLTALPIG